MSSFRICQISDLHITFEQETTINDIDVVANFNRVLDAVVKTSPDLIIVSGDLCYSENDEKVYEYVKAKLDNTHIPYCILAGNHDCATTVADTFGYDTTGEGDLYYTREINEYLLIFMDSSKHSISSGQLKKLGKDLETSLKPVLFCHHPPVLSGVPFMDNKYPLQNMEECKIVLSQYKGDIPVFCGHYHNDKEVQEGNLSVYLAPSIYYQISSKTSCFKIGSFTPGWRNITLSNTVDTEVVYLNLLKIS